VNATDRVRSQLSGSSIVRSIDGLPRGHVRIATALQYPDGTMIDVFLRLAPLEAAAYSANPGATSVVLSDMGNTAAWLLDVGVRPWQSKKRQAFLDDALEVLGVGQRGGELTVEVKPGDELGPAVLRLGQACMRVADLTFTRRASLVNPFTDDVEEMLVDLDLSYEPNVDLPTRLGTPVRVDYVVTGPKRRSAVAALTASAPASAHAISNEVFRKWLLLAQTPGSPDARVTILDDRVLDVFRLDDLALLGEVSDVLGFSSRDQIAQALAA
jgi:hypothetical protein